jgi:hypothetical protein
VPRSGLAAHAKDGETLAGIGPVFRQKFTIKAGKKIPGDVRETVSQRKQPEMELPDARRSACSVEPAGTRTKR